MDVAETFFKSLLILGSLSLFKRKKHQKRKMIGSLAECANSWLHCTVLSLRSYFVGTPILASVAFFSWACFFKICFVVVGLFFRREILSVLLWKVQTWLLSF